MNPHDYSSLKLSEEAEGRVLIVELDHGRANEMGRAEIEDWERLVEELSQGSARVLISFSRRRSRRGTPIFIAGANVTERSEWTDAEIRAHVRRQRSVLAQLRQAPVYHVVLVDGVALGWGTEFLITADYRLTTPSGKFGLPETGLGILPGAGDTSELWSLIGIPQALRLGATGERIDAQEALRIGLVQEFVEDVDQGLLRARAMAQMVCRCSPSALAAFKRGLLASVGSPAAQRMEIEAQAYEHCVSAGDAAIGRANFKKILSGESVEWGPRSEFKP